LAEVHRANGRLRDGHLVAAAGAVVRDAEGILCHEPTPPEFALQGGCAAPRARQYNLCRGGPATDSQPLLQSKESRVPRLLPTLSSRAEGAVLGLAAGRWLAAGDGPDGELALTLMLAEQLGAGRPDLQRVAERWVERLQSDSRGIAQETADALSHIARHGAPPRQASGRSADPLVRCLPVALAMFDSPRNLVSGTYYVATLTHPDPAVTWSAVAVNLALARFLQGKRDFIADVLEALRSNPVPEELLGAIRRVPLERRPELSAAE